jgi:murein DD-endopeptidase MepM/ murein hydrolase activator NlpD
VRSLTIDLDETHSLTLERGPAGYVARTDEHPFVIRLRAVQGEISSSLFAAAAEVGLSTPVTVALAGVFGYDIDFLQDLRVGDRFNVVHQELWRDGAKVRDGAIVVAEFVNAGRVLRAVRFEHPDGDAEYYAPDGSSMRKALMRNPIDFARISSSFSLRRHHPILNKVRAHKGVDYGAPTGTPVRATGDGKVVFRGVKGGYGNTIIVRHGATFSTLYAHLSRFAPGLGTGSRVQQEQVIGYVGRTGLATASHLHYEVLVDGVHRNPRTVKLPDAAPIPAELREAFIRRSADALALLPAPPLRLAPVSTRT